MGGIPMGGMYPMPIDMLYPLLYPPPIGGPDIIRDPGSKVLILDCIVASILAWFTARQ